MTGSAYDPKAYVGVEAYFSPEGKILPRCVEWEDGRRYAVDQVVDIRPAASLRAGGAGMRYTVRIGQQETFIFLEENRWFVERKGL